MRNAALLLKPAPAEYFLKIYTKPGLRIPSAAAYGKILALYEKDSGEMIYNLTDETWQDTEKVISILIDPMRTYRLEETLWDSRYGKDRIEFSKRENCVLSGDGFSGYEVSGFGGTSASIYATTTYGLSE